MTVSTQETASSEYSAAVSPEESSLKPSVPEPKNYSAEDISMFRKQESVAELLFIAERYLGRILTPTDMNSILYWYDSPAEPGWNVTLEACKTHAAFRGNRLLWTY